MADSEEGYYFRRGITYRAREEFYRLFTLHVKDDTANNGSGLETLVHAVRFRLVSSPTMEKGD